MTNLIVLNNIFQYKSHIHISYLIYYKLYITLIQINNVLNIIYIFKKYKINLYLFRLDLYGNIFVIK